MRYFELNNDKNLTYQNLWNVISDQRKFVVLNEYIRKKKVEKSVIEVSVLGNYKIKGKLNPINKQMEGKLKLKGKSMT